MHHGASMHRVVVESTAYFQALSDPIRVRIIRLLADSGAEACLCDLSESLGEPDYKLSRHVKVLRQSGMLSAEKEGRWVYHKIVQEITSLKHLYLAIEALPDDDKVYASDLKKFRRLIAMRKNSRCKAEKSESTSKKRSL